MAKVYLVAALSVAIVCGSVAAEARGRGGFGGPGRHGGGPGSELLERVLHPCRAACLDAGRSCFDSADAAAVTCAESTCAAAIEPARAACADDALTDACQDARSTLRECMQPCLTARRTATGACRTTVDACLDACDGAATQ